MEQHYTESFESLVAFVVSYLEATLKDAPPERSTYMIGEGFGGLLALAVALATKSKYVGRLVLINPCTCLADVPIRRVAPLLAALPPAARRAAPLAIVPLLGGSPTDLLGHLWARARAGVDGGAVGPPQLAAAALQALMAAVEQLQLLTRHLPASTLLARLQLLDQGLQYMADGWSDVEARVMILAGGKDALLPSTQEARRLVAELPRAFERVFPNAGHALLLDPSVDLLGVMREEGFLVPTRHFTAPVKPGTQMGFGMPGPIELPTPEEVARVGGRLTAPLRRLCSPVFFSTLPDGTVVEGLGGLDTSHRPLLFVGNHQLYALDMNVLVEEIYLQKGMLLRGLAHPALFKQSFRDATPSTDHPAAPATSSSSGSGGGADEPGESAPGVGRRSSPGSNRVLRSGGGASTMNNVVPLSGQPQQQPSPPQQPASAHVSRPANTPQGAPFRLGEVYRTFGAVVVTPTAFFKLLAGQEAVLLYPGGVREGFKRRNEKYELFWPEKGEFVRMAARHNAWVIPVSAVGWEDCVDIVMDSDEIAAHPWLGGAMKAAAAAAPSARRNPGDVDQTFIPPLIAPKAASRLYFLLGRPVPLHKHLCNDRDAADEVYGAIKKSVKDGITWLLDNREQDPYKDVVRRVVYENNPLVVRRDGTRRQAPTFSLRKEREAGRSTTPSANEPASR